MNIAIDIRCLQEKNLTGVGEYAYNLLKNIFELDSKNKYFLFANARKPINNLPPLNFNHKNVTLIKFNYPNKLLSGLLFFFKRPKLDNLIYKKTKIKIDHFFFPNINFLAVNCPYSITCHDLSFKIFPYFFSLKQRLWHWLTNPQKIFTQAQNIITVSDNTKNDLIKIYNLSKEKITTVYPGLPGKFEKLNFVDPQKEKIRQKYNLPKNFILYLGTIEPRKNIFGLIQAFEIFSAQDHYNYHLILAGKPGFNFQKINQQIKKSPAQNKIRILGYIEKQEKIYFYNLAKIFVFPSFYEGFGFPPLEAIACGCPTVISHTSSLAEVCGSQAISVDPHNINDIALALIESLNTKKQTTDLSEKFNWQKTAQQILDVFNK